MSRTAKVAERLLLGTGGALLVLGLLMWAGVGGKQVGGLHVTLGMVLVLTLWTLCVAAARSGVSRIAVALAASCGVIVFTFGIAQEQIVPGDWHWTIRVAHVVISMGAIWWGRRLASLMRQRETSLAAATGQVLSATSAARSPVGRVA
jgi:hypothetical protein